MWKQAGGDAGSTARVDAALGLPREFHATGRICDILYTADHQNLMGLTPVLADISLTHPFVGNAVNWEQWGTYMERVCASEHR